MYADFEYYREIYGGTEIESEAVYSRCAAKAGAFLNAVTYGRLAGFDTDDNVKQCFCELCELVFAEPKNTGFKSESNDGYSVVYDRENTLDRRMYNVCRLYLAPELLYRGTDNA